MGSKLLKRLIPALIQNKQSRTNYKYVGMVEESDGTLSSDFDRSINHIVLTEMFRGYFFLICNIGSLKVMYYVLKHHGRDDVSNFRKGYQEGTGYSWGGHWGHVQGSNE